MKSFKILIIGIVLSSLQINCGSLASTLASLTSVDCDNFILNELDSSLSEECRNLDSYLDTDSSSLTGDLETGLSQVIPTTSISTDKLVFLQLTDENGDPLNDVDLSNVDVKLSEDGGSTFTDVAADDVTKLSERTTLESSIMMILDYSGSILDSDLEDINSGLHVFYDNIIADSVSEVYQSGIIKFSTEVDLIQDFTSTKSELLTAVDDSDYLREYTSLYDSIYDGVDEIKDEATSLKLIILFTDGVDNDSVRSKDEAIAHAVDNRIPVCVIGVGFADVSVLEEIANDTGCFYIYKTFFSSLDEAFEIFADQINNFQMISLPDSFDASSGLLKVTVDDGTDTGREILQSF